MYPHPLSDVRLQPSPDVTIETVVQKNKERQQSLSGALRQLDIKTGHYGQDANGLDRIYLDDDSYWCAWDSPAGEIVNFVDNSDYGTATLTTTNGTYEFVTQEILALRGRIFGTSRAEYYFQGWGIKPDNGLTDNKDAIAKMMSSIPSGGRIWIVGGTFGFSKWTTPPANTQVYGSDGGELKMLGEQAVVLWENDEIHVRHLKINGNQESWKAVDFVTAFRACKNYSMKYCEVYNGLGVGIGIGKGRYDDCEHGDISNNHVHHIGVENHSVIPDTDLWANGIANTKGKNTVISMNYIHDIYGTGAINCEGLTNENISIWGNFIWDTYRGAPAIKTWAGGEDQPPKNVTVRGNYIWRISLTEKENPEAVINIRYGENVSVLDNYIWDCPNTDAISNLASGVAKINGNHIWNCPKGRIVMASNYIIEMMHNIIECPDGANYKQDAPLYCQSYVGNQVGGRCNADYNTIINAPNMAAIINFHDTPGSFTNNTLINCGKDRSSGTGTVVGTLTNYKKSRIGNNTIIDTSPDLSARVYAYYSLSGNKAAGSVILPDVWNLADETLRLYDTNYITEFIQSELPLFSAPPSSGYNVRSRIVWNISPDVGEPIGWVCRLTGTPGTWNGFGTIVG